MIAMCMRFLFAFKVYCLMAWGLCIADKHKRMLWLRQEVSTHEYAGTKKTLLHTKGTN